MLVNDLLSADIAAQFNDPDGDALGYSLTTDAPFLTLSPEGLLSGTPSTGDKGEYTVTIEATDGEASVATTFTLTVPNQPPVVNPVQDQSVLVNDLLSADIAAQFNDPDGDALVYSLTTDAPFLTLSPEGLLSGTPSTGDRGEYTVTIEATDGEASVATTFTLTVPNQSPVVNPIQDQSVLVNDLLSADIAAQFNDPDGDTLVYSLTTDAGFLTLSDGILSGTPSTNDKGEYTVTIEATDGAATGATTFTLTVPNQSPVVNPIQDQSVLVDNLISTDVAGHFSDPDGDLLTYSLTTGPSFLSLSPGGILSGTPSTGDKGEYTVTIEATDGAATVATTFTLTVPNQSPVVNPIQDQSVLVNDLLSADIAAQFNDPDGDALGYSLTTDAPFLTLSPEGLLSGTPSTGDKGEYTVTIEATDGAATVATTFTLTVPNQSPVVNPIQDQSVLVNDLLSADIAAQFNDPDGDALGYSLTTDAPFLTLSPAGILSGTPSTGDKGEYTVTIEADDGTATVATTFTLTVPNQSPVVNPIQDQSVLVNNSISTDVAGQFGDPDGDPLTYSLSTGATFLSLSGGTLFGTPSTGDQGVYSVTIAANDGAATVATTFTLTVPNQSPVVNPIQDQSVLVNNSISTDVAGQFGDPDGDPLTYSLSTGATFLSLSGGTLFGTPSTGDQGVYSVTIAANDGAATVTTTFSLTVSAAPNQAPVADDESVSVVPGGVATEANLLTGLTLLDGDTDPDGDNLTAIAQVSQATSYGTVTVNTDGSFDYSHDGSPNYSDSFTYDVTDGNLTSTGTVTVSVLPQANSPATGVAITGSLEVGSVLTAYTSGITDADGMSGAQFTYQWFLDDVAVLNETSETYTTLFGDIDKEIKLEVSFIDDAGHLELVSDTAFVTQSENVSGTQTYTLIPSYDDYVSGSAGNDTITLIGEAQVGDLIDLGDGADTLILSAGVNNNVVVENVEVITGSFNSNNFDDIVTIQGEQTSLGSISLGGDDGDKIINEGLFQTTDIMTAFGSNFDNAGYLRLDGADIWLQSFDNQQYVGRVLLENASILEIDSSASHQLNNNGIFRSIGSSPNFFGGEFVNNSTGYVEVLSDLTFLAGSTLNATNGVIELDAGTVLLLNDTSTLIVGSATTIINLATGVAADDAIVRFNGGVEGILNITDTYNVSSAGAVLDFAGTVNVTGGVLTIERGADLQLTGDDIDATLENYGKITVKNGVSTLDGTFTQFSSGELIIDSVAGIEEGGGQGAGVEIAATNLDNLGLIQLDNSVFSEVPLYPSVLTIDGGNGSLTNASGATIESLDTGGNLSNNQGSHVIDAQLINDGKLEVGAGLVLNSASGHTNTGLIVLKDWATLTFQGGSNFTNTGTLYGEGTVASASMPFINEGILEPQSTPGTAANLTFSSSLDLNSSGVVNLDIYGETYDSITISGSTFDIEGTINLNFVSSSNGSATLLDGLLEINNVIDYGTANLSTTGWTVTHNLGDGYIVSLVPDASGGTHYDVSIQAPPALLSISDGEWSTASIWEFSVLPIATDIVHINHDITQSTTADVVAQSLLIWDTPSGTNSPTLTISDGSVEVTALSRIDGNSNLDLTGGTLKLTPATAEMIVEGTMNWSDGSVVGAGSLNITGTLDLDVTLDPTLDAALVNHGWVTITGSGDFLSSSDGGTGVLGSITNKGFMTVNASTDFWMPVTNDAGEFNVSGAGTLVYHSANFSNLAGSSYNLGASNNVTLYEANFTNAGIFEFGIDGSTLNESIFDLGFSTGAAGNFTNTGRINVKDDAVFDIEGATLDSSEGGIYLADGKVLTIDGGSGGTFKIGGGTVLEFASGTSSIEFYQDVTIDVTSAAIFDSSVQFDSTYSTLTIIGEALSIGKNGSLTLHGNTSVDNSSFLNFGTLTLDDGYGDISITSALFENQGVLDVQGGSFSGVKIINNAFDNRGTINFTAGGSSSDNVLEVGAGSTEVLTNKGVINSTGSGAAENVLRGTLVNEGNIQVQHALQLAEETSVSHENNGSIEIDATLTLGTNNSLVNSWDLGTGKFGYISGVGTLNVSASGAVFQNDGVIQPGGSSVIGTLTIDGNANTEFTESSVVEIDLGGSGADQLAFTGVTPALNGRLKITTLAAPSVGYNIITSTTSPRCYLQHD